MKKVILALVSLMALSNSFAADLELDGERWLSKWTAYVCDDGNTLATVEPAELTDYQIEFTKLSTDRSLDNVLIKATFIEAGVKCSYSSILLADNAAWTIGLVESRALPQTDCAQGKAALDSILEFNTYKYLHGRAAIFFPFSNSEVACTDGAGHIGIHFQATGRVQ